MSDVGTTAHQLSSDTSKQKTDSYIPQRREWPPTCDTRLTSGTRLAREAASACKRRRIESSVSIPLRITHLPNIRLLSASCNGESLHPPVTPV